MGEYMTYFFHKLPLEFIKKMPILKTQTSCSGLKANQI